MRMKHSVCFLTVASLLLVNTAFADNKIPAHHSFLLTNNYDSIRTISLDNLPNTYNDTYYDLVPALEAGFVKGKISIKTGKTTSENITTWSKYYLNSAITIHQNKAFNLSITASIEQFKDSHLNLQISPLTESRQPDNEAQFNYSYGVMGSYSINSTWHFSGGIIHSSTINEANNTAWHTNSSMALIGTTYSF
jgi:hypothetical protein